MYIAHKIAKIVAVLMLAASSILAGDWYPLAVNTNTGALNYTNNIAFGGQIIGGGVVSNTPTGIEAAGGLTNVSGSIGFSVDGGGFAVTPCTNRTVVAYAQTIAEWFIVGDVSSTTVVDIRTNNVSIVGAGNKPTLSSSISSNAVVSGWTTTALPKGTIVQFVVISSTTATQLNVVLGTRHQ